MTAPESMAGVQRHQLGGPLPHLAYRSKANITESAPCSCSSVTLTEISQTEVAISMASRWGWGGGRLSDIPGEQTPVRAPKAQERETSTEQEAAPRTQGESETPSMWALLKVRPTCLCVGIHSSQIHPPERASRLSQAALRHALCYSQSPDILWKQPQRGGLLAPSPLVKWASQQKTLAGSHRAVG